MQQNSPALKDCPQCKTLAHAGVQMCNRWFTAALVAFLLALVAGGISYFILAFCAKSFVDTIER